MAATQPAVQHFRLGLLFAVGSAFTFGLSGPLAKSLMEAGWSPTAAVLEASLESREVPFPESDKWPPEPACRSSLPQARAPE